MIKYIISLVLLFFLIGCEGNKAYGQEGLIDELCIRAIVGESSNQGYQGMLALASGLRNRGTLQGVYGLNAKHKEPAWVWEQARKAWAESEHNRIHMGTHWENIKAFGKPSWAYKMTKVYEYKDHIFYK